ncbi:monocarboxylate transporter 12-like [Amphiura filiformis]|uniref:monocarboxylate transporter 12-like n=1 Tax=Amphiura filiformis TaxID=82378 RepID=UPI003B228191
MRHHQKDIGYSWIIALSAFTVTLFQMGVIKVFAVFIPHLVEQLNISTWVVGMAASIGIGLRHLLGHGLPGVAKVLALKDFFETKFSQANGIAFAGGAIGMIILAPLTEFLIGIYGWRGAMMIIAAMNMNICVAGALMVQPLEQSHIDELRQDSTKYTKYERLVKNVDSQTSNSNILTGENSKQQLLNKDKTSESKESSTKVSKFCDLFGLFILSQYPIFTINLIFMLIYEMVLSGWVLFIVSYTITLGYSNQIASFLSAVGGGGSLMGRLILGPFIDNGIITGRMMFFMLATGGAICMCCYPFTDSYWLLIILSFMTGVCLASGTPIFIVMINEMVESDSSAFVGAVGLHFFFRGIGRITGGPITGKLYDTTGSFYMAFLTLGTLAGVAALLALVNPRFISKTLTVTLMNAFHVFWSIYSVVRSGVNTQIQYAMYVVGTRDESVLS